MYICKALEIKLTQNIMENKHILEATLIVIIVLGIGFLFGYAVGANETRKRLGESLKQQ